MSQRKEKPSFMSFGENDAEVASMAESVQRDYGPDKGATKPASSKPTKGQGGAKKGASATVYARVPKELADQVRRIAFEHDLSGGPYPTLAAVVEHSLRLGIADISQGDSHDAPQSAESTDPA